MTTFYYYNSSKDNANHPNTTTTTNDSNQQEPPQSQPQLRSNIPKSIFTSNLSNDTSWSKTPLSPPLGKMDNQHFTTTTSSYTGPAPMATTANSISTPLSNRRSSNTWHSLWTSSTWQPNQQENEQTSPIDLEFLDSPYYNDDKLTPTTSNGNRNSSANTAALDDYFQLKEGVVLNQSQTISSPTRRPFQYSSSFIQKPDEYLSHPTGRERSASIWSFDWSSNNAIPSSSKEAERRHSIAAFSRPLTPPPQQNQQSQQKIQQLIHQVQQQQKIDEYFSPTTTMIDVQALGKGISLNQLGEKQLIYQVQFKVKHRFDYFYVLGEDKKFNVGDMVIVEADRGYDLGKIVLVIDTKEQRKKKKLVSGDTTIKRIFRHATPSELITYELKKQDEQKALVICQVKIKQKELNMEVVDAEYQWDRRKLTFYFKANERIDFRELVRELFKIYKTRIWMCASPLTEY